jgi:hypothetical protein
MLSAEIGMVQVSIVNPKATNVLNRTKKIATVVYRDGGYMAKGGEIYKIQQKFKYDLQPKWEDEKFQTGGKYYLSFKVAQDIKNKLRGLSSSMEYKVVKVNPNTPLSFEASPIISLNLKLVPTNLLKAPTVPIIP